MKYAVVIEKGFYRNLNYNYFMEMQILRAMREAGIQPDVVTYTTIIKVLIFLPF